MIFKINLNYSQTEYGLLKKFFQYECPLLGKNSMNTSNLDVS